MKFKCSYAAGNFWYTCVVTNFKALPGFEALVFTEEHEEGKTINDVKFFECENHPLEVFPVGGVKITIICDHNNLTSLLDDLFADIKQLQEIKIESNQLERLSSKLLKPIEATLRYSEFRKNPISNDNLNSLQEGKDDLK